MTATLRRTPCVGICSTTYGDLVCRGCKRFSHEIVEWNGFADEQQQLVWQRLFKLREGAVLEHLLIEDEAKLLERARAVKVPDLDQLTMANIGYEVLRRSGGTTDLSLIGIVALTEVSTASKLYQKIEQELYERSVAQYERDFHIPAQ